MGNHKKNRARKFRPNQQMRRNPKTGKVEKFEGKRGSKSPQPPQTSTRTLDDEKLTESQKKRITHPSMGFVPEKPQPRFRPCVCEGIDLELNNQRLLDLLKREKRAYDEETGTYTVLVLSVRFRRKHARHMRHFRKFLLEEQIRFVEV